ncbi:serine/threonine-protein kinase [Mycobacterium sp. 155]|uniref:serine/threonine-protein kinase n=1 Tax=Mycobacterium sp. 155 TaxID=1157943 RepID=UPI00036095F2|nr:serine/threonine-protein kinase [Mycobacterium sp. 155]
MASPHDASRVGTRFGPYELRSLIGVGGMGEVYRAYDTVKDRMVAVKLLRTEVAADRSYQARFRRESRAAARLQEPHVIPVHDFGDIDGVLYIDMRLVEGVSVKEALRMNGPLDPGRAVSIATQVASALDAAHAGGLVHRDIKPENVLLTGDDFAYLVDFGIAHVGGEATVTMTGVVIGSSAYMAPERFSGAAVGPPADVYALTCLLYECLIGRPPFETGDLRQLMSAHMFSAPPRPSIMRRGMPRAFDDVIARGMAKDPTHRYASAGELARAARAAISGNPAVGVAPPVPEPEAVSRPTPPPALVHAPEGPVRRSRWTRSQVRLVIATVLLLGVAAVLAAVLVLSGNGDGSTPKTAVAVSPSATGASAPTESSTEPSATTSTTRSAAAPMTGTDTQGFVGHTARCDSGSTPAAMIKTASSIAVICQSGPDSYYYRGERLSDGAHLEIAQAERSGDGFNATNPADGALYEIRPDSLTIISNGHVDSDEPAQQYSSG